MRKIPTLAVSSIALLIGCTEQQSLPSALTPGRPSFVTYTASTAAPAILGSWNGSAYTIAYDINDVGTIAGVSDVTSAVGWATGTNPAPKSTTAFLISAAGATGRAINSGGQVAGEMGSHAALWTPVPKSTAYTATDIGADALFVDVGATSSAAFGINASGQVVGYYRVGTVFKCFVWTPSSTNGTTGSAAEVTGLGGDFCVANDINSSGQIAGASTLLGGSPNHAFVRSGGLTTDLQPGADESYGAAINNAGQVAGFHTPAISPTSAAVWTPSGGGWGSAVDLGTPALSGQSGTITSAALDINDAGYVVGYTTNLTQTVVRAFFWQGTAFTELPDAGVSIVQANGLTNVMANRVIVTGSDTFDPQTNSRHGLRWVVTLKR